MTYRERYHEYLQSPAWRDKRLAALKRAKFKCECCGGTERLQVHHLTYDRVFHEDVNDLVVLCAEHHDMAEKLSREGLIRKDGNTANLAKQTMKALSYDRPVLAFKKNPKTNRKREWLANNPQFQFIMQLNKKPFKGALRDFLQGNPDYQSLFAIAMCMYKENHKARTMPFYKLIK